MASPSVSFRHLSDHGRAACGNAEVPTYAMFNQPSHVTCPICKDKARQMSVRCPCGWTGILSQAKRSRWGQAVCPRCHPARTGLLLNDCGMSLSISEGANERAGDEVPVGAAPTETRDLLE